MSTVREEIESAVLAGASLQQLQTLGNRLEAAEVRDVLRSLMFLAASSGHAYGLEWLVSDMHVPLLVSDHQKRTILHVAVEALQYELVTWLMDKWVTYNANDLLGPVWRGSIRVMYLGTNSAGHAPLEIAASLGDMKMIEILVSIPLYTVWNHTDFLKLNQSVRGIPDKKLVCLEEGETQGVPENTSVMQNPQRSETRTDAVSRTPGQELEYRRIDIRQTQEELLRCVRVSQIPQLHIDENSTLEGMKKVVEKFEWWPLESDSVVWGRDEKFWLHAAIESCAKYAKLSIMTWFLDTWSIEIASRNPLETEGFSVADYAACGQIQNYVSYEKDWMKEDGEDMYGLIRCSVVFWNGKDLLSLAKDIALRKEKIDSMDSEKLVLNLRKVKGDAEDNTKTRIEIIELLISRYKLAGIPRLDFIVMTGATSILKWLIEQHYVDLKAPILDAVTADSVGDEKCCVCLGPFRNPIELTCSHRLCRPCARQLFTTDRARDFSGSTICPLCRSQVQAPDAQPGDAVGMLIAYLRTYAWLDDLVTDDMSVGSLLMALSAGMGSLSILVLLKSMDVNLSHVFRNGRNIMHIAASRKQYLVVRWLGENGYLELIGKLSDDGLSPMIEAVHAGDIDIVNYIVEDKGLDAPDQYGRGWLYHASRAETEVMTRKAKQYQDKHTQWVKLPQLIQDGAPLSEITTQMDSLDMREIALRDELLENPFIPNFVCQRVIRHGRVDVLRYMCSKGGFHQFRAYAGMSLHTGPKWNVLGPKWNALWRGAVQKYGVNQNSFENLFSEVKQAALVYEQYSDLDKRLSQLVKRGCEVREIEEVLAAQEDVRKSVSSDFESWFEHHGLRLQSIFTRGLKPLFYVAWQGYVHLVDWLLNVKHQGDVTEASKALFKAVSAGKLEVVQYLFNWFVTKAIDINEIRSGEKYNEDNTIFEASAQSYHCSRVWKDSEISVDEHFAIVAWLASRPEIRLGSLSRALDVLNIRSRKSVSVSKVIKLYVEKGADYHAVDSSGKSIAQRLIDVGDMESVRWLAMDLRVDIQDLAVLDWFYPDTDKVCNILEGIKNEQRALFESSES